MATALGTVNNTRTPIISILCVKAFIMIREEGYGVTSASG